MKAGQKKFTILLIDSRFARNMGVVNVKSHQTTKAREGKNISVASCAVPVALSGRGLFTGRECGLLRVKRRT